MIFCDTEHLTNKFRAVPEIFLDELGTDDAQEGSRCLVCYCFCQEGFTCARDTVEDDTLWGLDAHFFV